MLEPMIDLTSGRVRGFVSTTRTPWRAGTDEPAEAAGDDIADAIRRLRLAGPSVVPLYVGVRADTVSYAPHRLRGLWPAMLHGQGRGPGTVLVLDGTRRTASAARLADGVERARRDGHRLAVGLGELAPAELAALRPDVIMVDARTVPPPDAARRGTDDAGSGTPEWDAAVLRAGGEYAAVLGSTLVARGVADDATLALVREHGVTVATGAVLAAEQPDANAAAVMLAPGLTDRLAGTEPAARSRPAPAGPPVTPGGPADARAATATHRFGPTPGLALGDLARQAVTQPADATGDDVRDALRDAPDSAGVVLVADGHPVGYLDRDRFLLAIAGPYGRAIYAQRPALKLADPPTTRTTDVGVAETLEAVLAGDPRRRYDDIVLVDGAGHVVGAVRFADLVAERAVGTGHDDHTEPRATARHATGPTEPGSGTSPGTAPPPVHAARATITLRPLTGPSGSGNVPCPAACGPTGERGGPAQPALARELRPASGVTRPARNRPV